VENVFVGNSVYPFVPLNTIDQYKSLVRQASQNWTLCKCKSIWPSIFQVYFSCAHVISSDLWDMRRLCYVLQTEEWIVSAP